ncbi:unnamed protein product [Ranitomeya imitator]|uniref:Phosphoribosylformylglycinamidine synthase N-terminal domain-containing protein n=1 Tax=Ranitomeya imitator TaxID=111125 RepID=A0ABN9M314_9NEOB|nr:unnamed protein product [Ranitomeya imitator]
MKNHWRGVLGYWRMEILHFYCSFRPSDASPRLSGSENIRTVQSELCYNVSWTGDSPPTPKQTAALRWLFSCPFDPQSISDTSFLHPDPLDLLVEVGPRLNFSTASSTNAASICRSIGLTDIDRIECSRRYLMKFQKAPEEGEKKKLTTSLYDRMTECVYPEPIRSFAISVSPEKVYEVDVIGGGRAALEAANTELGLAFDSWDLDYYTSLFQRVGRNPSSVWSASIWRSLTVSTAVIGFQGEAPSGRSGEAALAVQSDHEDPGHQQPE